MLIKWKEQVFIHVGNGLNSPLKQNASNNLDIAKDIPNIHLLQWIIGHYGSHNKRILANFLMAT